jgi:hypothetical protein
VGQLPGGASIGKTALALKLAERLAASYPDAQIYFDLKGVSANPLQPTEAMAYVIHSFPGAARLLKMRIKLSRSIGDIRGEAESSWALGNIYEEMGDLARAVELKEAYADYRQRISHPRAADTTAEVTALRVRLRQAAAAATSEPASICCQPVRPGPELGVGERVGWLSLLAIRRADC